MLTLTVVLQETLPFSDYLLSAVNRVKLQPRTPQAY